MIIGAEFDEVEDADSTSELDLSDNDSLPWLEADEDDDRAGGVDTAQVIGLALILLTVLAGVVGAIWYFGNQAGDASLVADGSVIEAPDGPIRERPQDPGGREFARTGDVAPIVSEGGTPEGVMNTDGAGGEPSTGGAENAGSTDSGATNAGAGNAGAGSAGGVRIQLAAYSSSARAEQGWAELSRRTDALQGVRYRIEQGEVDIGTVYRLQAIAADRAGADRLCAALKADGLDCTVKP